MLIVSNKLDILNLLLTIAYDLKCFNKHKYYKYPYLLFFLKCKKFAYKEI
jgi:hypothetical protein